MSKTGIKLRQKDGTIEIVKENGQIATCPYRSMISMQVEEKIATGQNQGMKIIQRNQKCTSDCAKFQAVEDEKGKRVLLSCGTGTVIYYDEIIQPDEKATKVLSNVLGKNK